MAKNTGNGGFNSTRMSPIVSLPSVIQNNPNAGKLPAYNGQPNKIPASKQPKPK